MPTFYFARGSGEKAEKSEPKVFRQGAGVQISKQSHQKRLRKIEVSHNGVRNPVIDVADDYDAVHVQRDFQQAHEEKLETSLRKHGTIHPLIRERREREGADWKGILESDQLQSDNFQDVRDKRPQSDAGTSVRSD